MTTAAKLERMESSVNTMARKVLDAVPISEPWTVAQILSEMKRLHGTAPALNVADACLQQLRIAGLVKSLGGAFQRVSARPRLIAAATKNEEEPMPVVTTEIESPKTAAAMIGDVSARLRVQADTLQRQAESLRSLADDIDAAGVRADDEIQLAGAQSAKLRQLRELLGSI